MLEHIARVNLHCSFPLYLFRKTESGYMIDGRVQGVDLVGNWLGLEVPWLVFLASEEFKTGDTVELYQSVQEPEAGEEETTFHLLPGEQGKTDDWLVWAKGHFAGGGKNSWGCSLEGAFWSWEWETFSKHSRGRSGATGWLAMGKPKQGLKVVFSGSLDREVYYL